MVTTVELPATTPHAEKAAGLELWQIAARSAKAPPPRNPRVATAAAPTPDPERQRREAAKAKADADLHARALLRRDMEAMAPEALERVAAGKDAGLAAAARDVLRDRTPEGKAAREWQRMNAEARGAWSSEKSFTAFRTAELTGRVRVAKSETFIIERPAR